MDERHWWIASKIQESFHIGGFDNPTMLEDFLVQPNILDTMNQFLMAEGRSKLFFYCEKPESGVRTTRELRMSTGLEAVQQVQLSETNIVYFLRTDVETDVDLTKMHKDIFCGELKGNIIETLHNVLGDLFVPLIKEKREWNDCSDDNKITLFQNVDRVMSILHESSVHAQTSKQQVLAQPASLENIDYKQQRVLSQDNESVALFEGVLSEWISTIEAILSDARVDRNFDPTSGPLAELERWQRRQRLVGNITDQLKTKECKTVLSVLIAAKSRLLKRWKQTDIALTDAVNETKDKVKFLESLKRHFDGFYGDTSPKHLMTYVLPNFLTALKQMDSVARNFARTGYLGLILSKITNQIVSICANKLTEWTTENDNDILWKVVAKEILDTNKVVPTDVKQLINEYGEKLEDGEKKYQQALKRQDKNLKVKEKVDEKCLLHKVAHCFQLQKYYREILQRIPLSINYTNSQSSNFGSNSSLQVPPTGTQKTRLSVGDNKAAHKSSVASSTPYKRSGLLSDPNGVNILDEQAILLHFDMFALRLRKVFDLLVSLSQFHRLSNLSTGLPKPIMDDLMVDEKKNNNTSSEKEKIDKNRQAAAGDALPIEENVYSNMKNLNAIVEDDEKDSNLNGTTGNEADEYYEALRRQSPTRLTLQEADILKHYYPPNKEMEKCSGFDEIIKESIINLSKQLTESLTIRVICDVESKERDKFENTYNDFNCDVEKLEMLISAYLKAIFVRKLETREALQLLSKFEPIQDRITTRLIISDKYAQILLWYENDMDGIRKIYETDKNHPPNVRNAPPVAGAVSWVRQLLNRIENPMTILGSKTTVTQLREFRRVVKAYNRLAETLVTFESLWLQQLKHNVELAKRVMSAPLYALKEGNCIYVNLDKSLFQTMQEVRWLKRMNIDLSDTARNLLQDEERFKYYRDQLELCVREFDKVQALIPKHLNGLFKPHVDECRLAFQPGLLTVTWVSVNIDAFLYQTHKAISKLESLVKKVEEIMTSKVGGAMHSLRRMVLFDFKMACDKCWPPGEFSDALIQSVKERGNRLHDLVTIIESGIKECASLLTRTKGHSFFTLNSVLKSIKRWRHKVATRKTPSRILTAQSSFLKNPSSSSAMSSASGRQTSSVLSMKSNSKNKLDQAVMELLNSYVEELYGAIEESVLNSLLILAESSGCDPEALRLSSPDHYEILPSSSRVQSGFGGAESAQSTSRPVSVLSALSNMSWTTSDTNTITYLRFDVSLNFNIPRIEIEPNLEYIQSSLNTVALNIVQVAAGIVWLGGDQLGDRLLNRLEIDGKVNSVLNKIKTLISDLQPSVQQQIQHLLMYDFLWKDDMVSSYKEFVSFEHGNKAMKREVKRLLRIEHKVLNIPDRLSVGCIYLRTDPIRDALHGFAMTWKQKYASVLHEEAKKKLDDAVFYRNNVRDKLDISVNNLEQLNITLCLLEELNDMENKVDGIYLPIENMYRQLKEFELRLPRGEIDNLNGLRSEWAKLMEIAEMVRDTLLKDERKNFEQELDKQVKNFTVEVMQFRNAFDAQGPAVAGIAPMIAVERLKDFQERYDEYEIKRNILDSVSKLFGIPCRPFIELVRTGEELILLNMLYGLFQKFIKFDDEFRKTLWADVDLIWAYKEVEGFWDECLALPSKLKDWDAYNEMKKSIQNYLNVLPILQRLASRDIRNRHWLKVMQVTDSAFQLEANVFRLHHLLDINLLQFSQEVENICFNASHEQQLELKLKQTEDEWTDQILIFTSYKRRGNIYLDKKHTERLLEQLDDSQAMLATMLTSRHVGPMRDEAANWAEKLKQVSFVLEEWLETQDLWQYLEAVFCRETATKDLPQEVKRFARIDKGWTKMMKRAAETRGVLQCCYGDDVPKSAILRNIHDELEICFKSLSKYLNDKRQIFPRFYFVSDSVLLAMLSKPNDLQSVESHLKSVFSAIDSIDIEKIKKESEEHEQSIVPDRSTSRLSAQSPFLSMHSNDTPPPRVDKRLHTITSNHPSSMGHSVLPSEMTGDYNQDKYEIVAIKSDDGEVLEFDEEYKIELTDGVEIWLEKIRKTTGEVISNMIVEVCMAAMANESVSCEDWVYKYPTQVCRAAMQYSWTMICEKAISEMKMDRKALATGLKKFSHFVSKIPSSLSRRSWKVSSTDYSEILQRRRLEALMCFSFFLKDQLEELTKRKIREVTDFDWRRTLRFYLSYSDTNAKERLLPSIHILDDRLFYGCEFYGCNSIIGWSPLTDKAFFNMLQATCRFKAALMMGETECGKTDTVRGLAQIAGMFLAMFNLSSHTDLNALSRILKGLSICGCWGLIEDIQTATPNLMSLLNNHIDSIQRALKSSSGTCILGDGHETIVNCETAFFLTLSVNRKSNNNNSISTTTTTFELPKQLKTIYRTVNLLKPDVGFILKTKAMIYCIKSPTILSQRLVYFMELCQEQFGSEMENVVSLSTMTASLKLAQRRILDLQALMESTRLTDGSRPEVGSRSNSQLSNTEQTKTNSSEKVTPLPVSRISVIATDKVRRTTPATLTAAGKADHAIVGKSISETLLCQFSPEKGGVVSLLIRDLFSGLPEPPPNSIKNASGQTISNAVEIVLAESNMSATSNFLEKCVNFYQISCAQQGIIVCGNPGNGKTTLISSVVNCLSVSNSIDSNHKLISLYPLVTNKLNLILGSLNKDGEWNDGLLTSTWKKINRNQSNTWLCLDGPITENWAGIFNTVLDSTKRMTLPNGDQLFISPKVRIIFETAELINATPSIVSKCGIVFMDHYAVGWRPLAKSWLNSRNPQEVSVLMKAFNAMIDPVCNFINTDCKPPIRLTDIAMFTTTLNLLSAMLADNIEIGGDLHIERLFIFCLIWSFGSFLNKKEEKQFSELLTKLTTCLPDDDRDISVFDYYVDDSGEWDPWTARMPENMPSDKMNLLNEPFIDTIGTMRTRLLLEFAAQNSNSVLLIGDPGCGKSRMIEDYMKSLESNMNVCKRIVFSATSTAHQLQSFIESNIEHRQGFVYGAKDRRLLKLFADDLNLPKCDENGVVRISELIRQLLDAKVITTQNNPFEWRTIEGFSILATMKLSKQPAYVNRALDPRLTRHFSVLNYASCQDQSLKTIFRGVLECTLSQNDQRGLDIEVYDRLVSASLALYQDINMTLRPSKLAGRSHYLFTMRTMVTIFSCLRKMADESREDETFILSFWKHETERVIRDSLARFSDMNCFDELLSNCIKTVWPDSKEDDLLVNFVTFPTEIRSFQQSVPRREQNVSTSTPPVQITKIDNLSDVHACLQTHLNRHNEELGNVQLDVMLSENVIANLVRLHRVLSYSKDSNIVFVGPIGTHLGTICKLALYISDLNCHYIDTSKYTTFMDGLRSAVRITGTEGKVLTIFLDGRHLKDDRFFDAINSVMISGMYPYLFTNDEFDGLLQALQPVMKKELPNFSGSTLNDYFVSRVRSNLHIILCLPPEHPLLSTAIYDYPGIIAHSQVIWFNDWPKAVLLGDANYFIHKNQLVDSVSSSTELKNHIVTALANIHGFVLEECGQTRFAGDMNACLKLKEIKFHEKKKDQIKISEKKLSNKPYSKSILVESIKNKQEVVSCKDSKVFVGPTTFRRFLDCFYSLFKLKCAERTMKVERYEKAVLTLDQTRKDLKKFKSEIKNVSQRYEETRVETKKLLNRLIKRATLLEKIKARVGYSNSLLAYLQMSEDDTMNNQLTAEFDDGLLLEASNDERDAYDVEFEKLREANLRSRELKAHEELEVAEKILGECRQALEYARKQVLFWKSKVERSTIDRLKAFQSPTILVGQIIEMVMILVGKRLPSTRLGDRPDLPKDETSTRLSFSSTSTKQTAPPQRLKPLTRHMSTVTDYSLDTGSSDYDDYVKKPDLDQVGAAGRYDRATWKQLQLTMNDSPKFVDMLHNVSWEDGIPNDVALAVESYFAKSIDGKLGGEGSTMLENAKEKSVLPQRSISPEPKGITVAAAKYSSEDAATLVEYTLAIVEYNRRCSPLKVAMDKKNELLLEIEEMERIAKEKAMLAGSNTDSKEKSEGDEKHEEDADTEYNQEYLDKIQTEVDQLQQKFDETVENKHGLELELTSMRDRVKAASDLLESIRKVEKTWKSYVKEFSSDKSLLSNCIVAAAYLVYCSPLNADMRSRLGSFFITICKHNEIPGCSKILLSNMTLSEFLLNDLNRLKWKRYGLPYSNLALDNTCFLIHDHLMNAWPLLCDSNERSPSWLENFINCQSSKITRVRYMDIRSQLESCLAEGTPLLVTDVDVETIISDKRFSKLIISRNLFNNSINSGNFKLQVGQHEVDCLPNFQLFLHTTTPASQLPPELAAYVTVINVSEKRKDIEEELLDRFTRLEKSRLWAERNQLLDERIEQKKRGESLETAIIDELASGFRIMSELNKIKNVAELKKQFDEANENICKIQLADEVVEKGREVYRQIAKRGAVCYDVGRHMAVLQTFYTFSWKQFIELYDQSIQFSDRSAPQIIVERLTWSCYCFITRLLLERDKTIFSILLALEVEDSLGRLRIGEREYLISPHLGAITIAKYVATANGEKEEINREVSKVGQLKKPFDWMTDEAYNNLQILAVHFPFFRDTFERMPRDGRETQWRSLCESDSAESISLPDKMDEDITSVQRMMIIRAVRPDKMLQLANLFVISCLGKRYIADAPYDIGTLLRTSKATVPIAFLHFNDDADMAERYITDNALRKNMKLYTVTLCGLDQHEERSTRKLIDKAITEQCWVLLLSADNSPKLLDNLSTFLKNKQPSDGFRCFVVAKVSAKSKLPTSFLHNSIRSTIDLPLSCKTTMQKTLALVESNLNSKSATRNELYMVLHNLVYLYSIIRLRSQYGHAGFVDADALLSLDFSSLHEVLSYTINEFSDGLQCSLPDGTLATRNPSWNGVRYAFSESLFGQVIGNQYDASVVSSMTDFWISPNTIRKDIELPRIKYKPPAVFFNSATKLQQLLSSLDMINVQHLESCDSCNMYQTPELILANDQYVFTRINQIYDNMPTSATLTHLLFPRPPTALRNATIASISHMSSANPIISSRSVYASASAALAKMRKEIELWEICQTAISKLPKGYNRDYVIERVKKIGGFTPFNLFLINELDIMYKLLVEMKSTLLAIKNACELQNYGDQLTECQTQSAYDLYCQRIPTVWRKMAYDTAPPPHHALLSWINDLVNRCQHIDRLLVLGRDKMPAYWLGAFFKPSSLIAVLKQEFYKRTSTDRAGNIDRLVIQTEVTARDKEHIREPPNDGMFVYGIYMWGCHYDKTLAEMADQPSRGLCTSLPVLHVTCAVKSEKNIQQDSAKANEHYPCPVYASRLSRNTLPIMQVDVRKDGIPSTRWPLRGLHATVRPY